MGHTEYLAQLAANPDPLGPGVSESFSSAGYTAAGSVPYQGCPKAATFDGTSGGFLGGGAIGTSGVNLANWSVEFWAKPFAGGKANPSIFSWADQGNALPGRLYVGDSVGGTGTETVRGAYSTLTPAGTAPKLIDSALLSSVWHHYVFVSDRPASSMYLYVDGVLRNTTTVTGGGSLAVYSMRAGLDILNGHSFKGDMAWISVWGIAMTQAQVTAHYNAAMKIILVAPAPSVSTKVAWTAKASSLPTLSARLFATTATESWAANAPALSLRAAPVSLAAERAAVQWSAPAPTPLLPLTLVTGAVASVSWAAMPSQSETLGQAQAAVAHLGWAALPAQVVGGAVGFPPPAAKLTYRALGAAARLPYDVVAYADYIAAVTADGPLLSFTAEGEDGPFPQFAQNAGVGLVELPLSYLRGDHSYTVEMWARPDVTYFPDSTHDPFWGWEHFDDPRGAGFNWVDNALVGSDVAWKNIATPQEDLGPPDKPWNHEWSHYVFVQDTAAQEWRIYVDKVLWSRGPMSAAYLHTYGQPAWRVGGTFISPAGSVTEFHGDVSTSHMFAKVLTEAQIAAHYDAPFLGNPGVSFDLEVWPGTESWRAFPPIPQFVPVSSVPTYPQYRTLLERDGAQVIYGPDDDLVGEPIPGYGAKRYLTPADADIVAAPTDSFMASSWTVEMWCRPYPQPRDETHSPKGGAFSSVPLVLRADPLPSHNSTFFHVGSQSELMYVNDGTAVRWIGWYNNRPLPGFAGYVITADAWTPSVYVDTVLYGYGSGANIQYIPGEQTFPGIFEPGHWEVTYGFTDYARHLPTQTDIGVMTGVPPRSAEIEDDSLIGGWHHYVWTCDKRSTTSYFMTLFVDGRVRAAEYMPLKWNLQDARDDTVFRPAARTHHAEIGGAQAGWRQVQPADWPSITDPVSGIVQHRSGPFPMTIETSTEWETFKGEVSQLALYETALDPALVWEHYSTAMAGITTGPLRFVVGNTARENYRPLNPTRVLGPKPAVPPKFMDGTTFPRPSVTWTARPPRVAFVLPIQAASSSVAWRALPATLSLVGDPPTDPIHLPVALSTFGWLGRGPSIFLAPVFTPPPDIVIGPPGPADGLRLDIFVSTQRVLIGVET